MSEKSHLSDYLNFNAQHYAGKLAVQFENIELTWHELNARVKGAAGALSQQLNQTQTQQVIGLLLPNSIDFVVSYLAILEIGHIALPIDVIFKPLEINAIVKQMEPVLVITNSPGLERLSAGTKNMNVSQLSEADAAQFKPVRLPAADQIASIFFTSGTTGQPKAVSNTHTNHIWNIQTCSEVWNWTSQDSLLISLRLSHMHGLVMGLSGALYHGNSLYLQDRFDPEDTLKQLASGKITLFTHSPLAYASLLQPEGEYDLSSVRLFISGSAPLPPKVWHGFKDKFGVEILEVYGSSETGRIASNLLKERIPGSPGRVLPGVDLKFSSSGEVLVKSPGVFPGYFKNETASQAAMTEDGYFKTGDIGKLENGRLVLKGRTSEIIRRQGYTISPRDVEWALHQNPDIQDAYVTGKSSPDQPDDDLIYFLVSSLDQAAVVDFCKQNLPSVWRSDKIIMVDKIPRLPSGKINIKQLQAIEY